MSERDRSKELEEQHNKGQEDAAKGDYKPPIGTYVPFSTTDEDIEDNDAYKKGWNHTHDQQNPGCFLTTACAEAAGLPDDCAELIALRRFRDEVLSRTSKGRRLVREYYSIAPGIVRNLDGHPRRTPILAALLSEIRECVQLVESGHHDSAIDRYRAMVLSLTQGLGTPIP